MTVRLRLRGSMTPPRPVAAVIDVDEFVEAASAPEFARLTQRADARVRDLGFVLVAALVRPPSA